MRLYGKNPVIERLRTKPATIRKIFIQQGFDGGTYIRKKAKQWGIPVFLVSRSKMIKLGRNINAQGILMDVEDFAYIPFDELLENAKKKRRTLIFLDGLNDPQNFGAMLRSLGSLGKFSVVIPTHHSVEVTEAVLRVSSGGDNYVPISKVSNLTNAIKNSQECGFTIIGAVVRDGQPLEKASFRFPLGIVIGSEQKGIRDGIIKVLDQKVTIPMANETMSLNVAHAASILCYEVIRQSKSHAKENIA